VAAISDASKVRIHGPGIMDGILAVYQSHFVVDTHGAGAGELTVKIRGPRGEWCSLLSILETKLLIFFKF